MLTLDQVKQHLKLGGPEYTDEDALLQGYLAAAQAAFEQESKRRWPVEGEPVLSEVIDPDATPPTTRFLGYLDPAVLTAREQLIATQWLRLVLGHWYENRSVQVVAVNVADVPLTAKHLMNLIRVPTI